MGGEPAGGMRGGDDDQVADLLWVAGAAAGLGEPQPRVINHID